MIKDPKLGVQLTPEERVKQALARNDCMRLSLFSDDFSELLNQLRSTEETHKYGLQFMCRVFGKEASGLSDPPYNLFRDNTNDVSWLRLAGTRNVLTSTMNLPDPVRSSGHGMSSLTVDARYVLYWFFDDSLVILDDA